MTIALIVLAAIALWVVSLYAAPFGPCPRCHREGRILRGEGQRRRPLICPACKGLKRRQRPGSRIVHQLAQRVRREIHRNREDGYDLGTSPRAAALRHAVSPSA